MAIDGGIIIKGGDCYASARYARHYSIRVYGRDLRIAAAPASIWRIGELLAILVLQVKLQLLSATHKYLERVDENQAANISPTCRAVLGAVSVV